MLVRSVVDNQVHHQSHVSLLELADQVVDILKTTVDGVDVFVVGLRKVSPISSTPMIGFNTRYHIPYQPGGSCKLHVVNERAHSITMMTTH